MSSPRATGDGTCTWQSMPHFGSDVGPGAASATRRNLCFPQYPQSGRITRTLRPCTTMTIHQDFDLGPNIKNLQSLVTDCSY